MEKGPARAVLARILSFGGDPLGVVLAPLRVLFRPRLSCRRGLYGPRQLGHVAGWRLGLWLHAFVGRAAVELHGHPVAGAGAAARHRQRPRSGAGLPRCLSGPDQHDSVDIGRSRDHRHGSRRGDRHRHRAQSAFQHPARDRRGADRARRVPDPVAAKQGLPLSRSGGDRPDTGDRGQFRDPDGLCRSGRRRCAGGLHSPGRSGHLSDRILATAARKNATRSEWVPSIPRWH